MATLEERVVYLEGRVTEHPRAVDGIREALAHLEVRMDARFAAVDRRMDALDARMDRGFHDVAAKCDAVDAKIDKQFMWVVGIQVTTLVAIVAALVAR